MAGLASCGGGGGGSSTPTASNPGNPAGPSSSPTSTPTSSPTSSAGPTPTPSPTHSGAPTPTPSPTPTAGFGSSTVNIGYGQTNGSGAYGGSGTTLLVSSASNSRGYTHGGNLEPGDPGALTSGGPNGNGGGGQGPSGGGAVDGVTCQPTMSSNYHVHFFVGVFYNGSEVALPAGLGMVNPGPPTQTINGIPNQSWVADCFYEIHVHDNSGMVHVESQNNGNTCGPDNGNSAPPCNYSIYKFGTFLDIWGVSVGPTNFGPLQGPVQVYTQPNPPSPYCTDPNQSCGTVASNTLAFYSGDPHNIPIYSHTVIWIVVGTPPASGLPNVFFTEGDP